MPARRLARNSILLFSVGARTCHVHTELTSHQANWRPLCSGRWRTVALGPKALGCRASSDMTIKTTSHLMLTGTYFPRSVTIVSESQLFREWRGESSLSGAGCSGCGQLSPPLSHNVPHPMNLHLHSFTPKAWLRGADRFTHRVTP